MEPTAKVSVEGRKRDSTQCNHHDKVATANSSRLRCMFKISLTNFRCFADPQPLEVLPVTFLVGENSTGKTTFLAALRQLIESFGAPVTNPFNSDPYFLGGFDQIAHYRGGKPGRAKYFALELAIPASGDRPASAHKYTFEKGNLQPELSQYVFTSSEGKVTLDLGAKTPVLKIEKDGENIITLSSADRMPPSGALRNSVGILRYIFENLFLRPDITKNKEKRAESADHLIRALLSQYQKSMRYGARNTFATAPVRTQPHRTYTPSDIDASSEGSHVPLEMARQKFNTPDEWKEVHDALVQFGHNSGLFDDIDIRLLGKRDGDPFQVLVRTKGPPFNLVDVGYGVSQALPIIYQLQQKSPRNAFLLQQPEVHLHPKAQAELGTLIAQLSKKRPSSLYVVETHSDYIIDRVRMEVAKGNLSHKAVTILFFRKVRHELEVFNIYLSEKGEVLHPPEGFRAFFLEEHTRLLGI